MGGMVAIQPAGDSWPLAWERRRLSGWRAECELALVEAEVLGWVAVDVGQGHVVGEERVPGRGVVYAAAQGEAGFPLQVLWRAAMTWPSIAGMRWGGMIWAPAHDPR
jgi:hypothetical protein